MRAHVLIIMATITVASTFPIGQKISPMLNPVLIVLYRFLLSVLMMLPLLIFTNKIKLPSGRQLLQYLVLGALYSGFFIFMFTALQDTTSLNTSVIYTLIPSMAAFFAYLILKEKVRSIHFILLPLGLLSTVWVIFEGSWQKFILFQFNSGDLVFALGCILIPLHSIFLKKFHLGSKPLDLVFWSMLCGTILLFFYALATNIELSLEVMSLELGLWISYLSVMTIVTSYIWAYGVPIVGPMKLQAYSYLIPSLVLVINWLVLDKLTNWIVLPGVFIGVVIMFFLQRSGKKSLTAEI